MGRKVSMTALNAAFARVKTVKMSAPARLVLIALANRHNQETGRCDPSVSRLCADTQCSERAVRLALRELEKNRLITTVFRVLKSGRGKKNMTNRYRVLPVVRGKNGSLSGAQYAGGMGHNMPPNLTDRPSAFDDLAMMIEAPDGADHE